MNWSQEAECSRNSGQRLSLPLRLSRPTGLTKGCSAVMSPPGHRVSQLPQRRLDHAGEGRSGRSGAAGLLGESALSQPSSCRNHPECHPGKGPAGMPPNCLPHLPRLPMNQETYILAAP